MVTRTRTGGLQVLSVTPGSYAARVGLEEGDLLLKLRNAPMLSRRQLATMMRSCATGEEIEAVWVRGREKMTAAAIL
jgi:S1-C subfamily serine protease